MSREHSAYCCPGRSLPAKRDQVPAALFLMALSVSGWATPPSAGTPITVASPDGKVRAELSADSGVLSYDTRGNLENARASSPAC